MLGPSHLLWSLYTSGRASFVPPLASTARCRGAVVRLDPPLQPNLRARCSSSSRRPDHVVEHLLLRQELLNLAIGAKAILQVVRVKLRCFGKAGIRILTLADLDVHLTLSVIARRAIRVFGDDLVQVLQSGVNPVFAFLRKASLPIQLCCRRKFDRRIICGRCLRISPCEEAGITKFDKCLGIVREELGAPS